MNKDIKIKKTSNGVVRGIPINIGDIAGKNKNITIEATLIDYKIFKHHDVKVAILKLKDSTGELIGLFVDEFSDLFKNSIYKIKGNVVLVDNIDIEDFNKIIDDDIKKYTIDNKLFCITSIELVKTKPLITSIQLSLYHNNKNDLVELNIPISAIEVLEINKISTSILYLKNGNYDEIVNCGCLWLRLLVDKLDKKITKILLGDICIFTIALFMDNGEMKYYNLPYYSDDGENNNLQQINREDNKIIIHMDEELK